LGRTNKGHVLQDVEEDVEGQPNEKISLRRIASDITPREVARILRASFRRETSPDPSPANPVSISVSYSNPTNSSVEATYRSHHDEELDSLSIINQETVSSTESSGSYDDERMGSLPWNHNFDFTSRSSRNRRSNDSQLGLLANQQTNGHTASNENLNYGLGIVNPTFAMTNAPAPGNNSSSQGHLRSHSLTVPVNTPNQSPSSRHHYHRTN
jgi:hypothetical protein